MNAVIAVSGDYPQPELLPPLSNAYTSSSANDKDKRKVPSLFDIHFPEATSLSASSSLPASDVIGPASVPSARPPMSVPHYTILQSHTYTNVRPITAGYEKLGGVE